MSNNVWEVFGSELSRHREVAGLTRQELGRRVLCSGSYIGLLEAASRRPALDLAIRFDRELRSGNRFARICQALTDRPAEPDHFLPIADLQRRAATISEYAPTLVPPLLQTEPYARALIRAAQADRSAQEIEELVQSRVARGRLLEGPTPPTVWVILDESVLMRPIGSRAVTAAQLRCLVELAERRRLVLQVLTYESGHPPMEGPLTLLTFPDRPAMARVESAFGGHLIDRPENVARLRGSYDYVRAAASSPRDSLELLRAAAARFDEPS
ncbi:transcriptional regulator with XRE-family HTH domain [Kitasatospora sp. MAP12-15]|uniref:helix-turn-helix domain-containing protein n=1 Tax=unclassified Kitasatospora TaxID=2633591 RepID=UPI002476659F|nr:helix-turn-helix transcriptional regulator [Kitasatospora sp. MAP12-44]MDH6109892.1 transcriptional regulator with XRE-family HTH domain [Kitasatospora sp. MAP12-44]